MPKTAKSNKKITGHDVNSRTVGVRKRSQTRNAVNPLCVHGYCQRICIICKPSLLCVHDKRKSSCIICKPSLLCQHGKRKCNCPICKPSLICRHEKHKRSCTICTPSLICIHEKRARGCKICNQSYVQAIPVSVPTIGSTTPTIGLTTSNIATNTNTEFPTNADTEFPTNVLYTDTAFANSDIVMAIPVDDFYTITDDRINRCYNTDIKPIVPVAQSPVVPAPSSLAIPYDNQHMTNFCLKLDTIINTIYGNIYNIECATKINTMLNAFPKNLQNHIHGICYSS